MRYKGAPLANFNDCKTEDSPQVRDCAMKLYEAARVAAGVYADTPDMSPWLIPRDRPEPQARCYM